MMTYETCVRRRTESAARAFSAIEKIKGIIAQLEHTTARAADGHLPDLGALASMTSGARRQIDEILVALTEARIDDDGFSQESAQ